MNEAALLGLRRDALSILNEGLAAVQPARLCLSEHLKALCRLPLDAYGRVVVVGIGKASLAMGAALEGDLGDRLDEGMVVVPAGYPESLPAPLRYPSRLRVVVGGHPVPNTGSVKAARHALGLLRRAGENDLVVLLISGGGSALCADFQKGISLDDASALFSLLLRSGASIHDLNTVRRHISTIGGGRLALAAAPAEVVALVLSDVPGDDPSVVAGGPASPDETTFADAVRVLHAAGLWHRTPAAIRGYLDLGEAGRVAETLKLRDGVLDRVRLEVVATNGTLLAAAAASAERLGYEPQVQDEALSGEASHVGSRLGRFLRDPPVAGPTAFLWGGETTVTVRGDGRGGRNQELALAAAIELSGARYPSVLLSGASDGVDGPTDAAGAWADPFTLSRSGKTGTDARSALASNDSYTLLDAAGALIRTLPSHTNVMDAVVALIRP